MNSVIRGWRLLAARLVVVSVVIALIALIPAMPAGSASEKDMSTVSMSFNAGEQGPANISSHAYASHMHFEHHQLVRAENAFVMPALDSVWACYSTGVSWLASLKPAPLRRPPRA
jgi:hypothetical protein